MANKKIKVKINKIYYVGNDGWHSLGSIGEDGVYYKLSGVFEEPYEGQELEVEGEYTIHPKYGPQIEVEVAIPFIPKSQNGLIKYLSGSMFKGIGKKLATEIIQHFNESCVLDVIRDNPERLKEINGISEKKIKALVDGVTNDTMLNDFMKSTKGAYSATESQRIIKTYGKEAIKKIQQNPYNIIYDVDGISFKKADNAAKKMGISSYDSTRVNAGVTFALKSYSEQNGSTYASQDDLLAFAKDTLFSLSLKKDKKNAYLRCKTQEDKNHIYQKYNFTEEDLANVRDYEDSSEKKDTAIGKAILQEIDNGRIVYEIDEMGNGKFFWKYLYDAEITSTRIINDLIKQQPIRDFTKETIEKKVKNYEKQHNFSLEPEQKNAVIMGLTNRFSVITGGPGCGKTTILDCLLTVWGDKPPAILCAPTGRAAQRMKESTNREATTIHRRLRSEEYKDQLVIIDETSMLDIALCKQTLELFQHCQIIFVGDVDQLPSVGPGTVLKDLVNSKKIPTTKLIKGHRNQGRIKENSQRINKGYPVKDLEFGHDFTFREVEKNNLIFAVTKQYEEYLKTPNCKKKDIGILCAQKIRGSACVNACNEMIRAIVNPENKDNYKIPGTTFRLHDRIMCTVNKQDKIGVMKDNNITALGIYNGDCGEIVGYSEDLGEFQVETDDGRLFWFDTCEYKLFVLAYAITIHKSQGSEYKYVILPFTNEHYCMNKRNVLYTAVTRAKESITILGEMKALAIAINNDSSENRYSDLQARIDLL